MTTFSRIVTALDMSGMDEKLIQYTHALARPFQTEKVYFVHIIPDFTLPEKQKQEFMQLFAPDKPLDEVVQAKLANDVQTVFSNNGIETSVEVREGKPYEKLIHWTKVRQADLLVVGNKSQSEGSGITARRVARKTPSNVLFLTEKADLPIREIIVPLDLSDDSAHALQTALQLRHHDAAIKISVFIVVDVPSTVYPINMHRSRLVEVLKENATNNYQEFLQKHDIQGDDLELVIQENSYFSVADHIKEFAEKRNASLIIMGAQGHTPFEDFLFGSVTEKLVENNKSVPILVVR